MKYLIYLFSVLFCLTIPVIGFAQTELTDSLTAVLKNPSLGEKEKPVLLNQLAEIYRTNKNYGLAESKASESARIALQNKDYTDAVKAYTLLVNIKTSTGQLSSAKRTSDSTLVLAKKAKDPVAMAYAYYAQVLVYKILDDAQNVVKFCGLALKQLEKKSDPYIASKIYYRLYAVYSGWNNEAKANLYASKATENVLLTTDYNHLSNCYTALSVAHEYNYNTSKNKAELDSVLFYLKKSEMLYHQYPGHVANHTYAIACIDIASFYLRYFSPTDLQAKSQAMHYTNTAISVLKGVDNSQEILASGLGILSEYAKRGADYGQQEAYLLQAYEVIKTGKPIYYYTMLNVVQALADFYEKKGDLKKAIDFQKEITTYTLKSFNEKQALNAQKLEIQYETEKKNNEMNLLKEREQSHKRQNYLYACVAVISFFGLLFMFRSYHFKLRYSLQLEKQLDLEKQDSALKVKLEQEEQARLKAEQQLLETQQLQLKKEAMANVLQLEHKNQMLLQIKEKLNDGNPVNMQKLWKEEMVLDSDFEDAKMQIQKVHPDFFSLINHKAGKKLSALDLKLCAYIYLKMDTRQIAQMMHIEAKSVRMSKYRIKQKLGLDKEEDLNVYLQEMGTV
jgi:DNA-binding CsgD family transcriptional regulator